MVTLEKISTDNREYPIHMEICEDNGRELSSDYYESVEDALEELKEYSNVKANVYRLVESYITVPGEEEGQAELLDKIARAREELGRLLDQLQELGVK